eukprot:scaffold1794_cov71-Phaeocystis_antarctica.AAC.3
MLDLFGARARQQLAAAGSDFLHVPRLRAGTPPPGTTGAATARRAALTRWALERAAPTRRSGCLPITSWHWRSGCLPITRDGNWYHLIGTIWSSKSPSHETRSTVSAATSHASSIAAAVPARHSRTASAAACPSPSECTIPGSPSTSSSSAAGVCLVSLLSRCTAAAPCAPSSPSSSPYSSSVAPGAASSPRTPASCVARS